MYNLDCGSDRRGIRRRIRCGWHDTINRLDWIEWLTVFTGNRCKSQVDSQRLHCSDDTLHTAAYTIGHTLLDTAVALRQAFNFIERDALSIEGLSHLSCRLDAPSPVSLSHRLLFCRRSFQIAFFSSFFAAVAATWRRIRCKLCIYLESPGTVKLGFR